MIEPGTAHPAQDGFVLDGRYYETPPEHLRAMTSLFEKLSAGEHPDFLDVMAAISEMVAFWTDCDSNPVDLPENNFCMSEKKCRFCD